MSGSEAIILAALNLIHLCVSAYNARKIKTVRTEQKAVAQALRNGTVHATPRYR